MSELSRRGFVKLGVTGTVAVLAGIGAIDVAAFPPPFEKKSTRMGEGTMKALVVYGTKSGCTEGIAEKIGATLSAKGALVDVKPAESAGSAADYDFVVFGSGVRVGAWHDLTKRWVRDNAEALASKPHAMYTCCLTLANDPSKTAEVKAYTDPLIEEYKLTPADIGLFAGWNEPKHFSFIERLVMKAMKAPVGDFRDYAAVAQWTESVAPKLGLS